MIDTLDALFCIDPAGQGVLLHGSLPEDIPQALIVQLRSDKAVIRRVGDRLLVILPQDGEHLAWILSEVPSVTDLPGLMDQLKASGPDCLAAARKLRAERAGRQSGMAVMGEAPGALATGPAEAGAGRSKAAQAAQARAGSAALLALARMAGAEKMSSAAAAQVVADACVEAGIARAAAVAICDGRAGSRGVGALRVSDRALDPVFDEIRQIIASYRAAEGQPAEPLRIRADDLDDSALDAALLARMMEAGELLLDLPAVGHEAPAILLIDPSPEADTAGLAELVTVAGRRPSKARRSARARVLKGTALALALAGLVWLALPAPLIVTASALSQPAQARAVTLPFDAYLREMRVEVGEAVDAGEVLAVFGAPEIEEQAAQARLQLAVEAATAQTALADNDYGAYVLSEQRQEALRRQLDQLQSRLDRLQVRAPEAGRVISSLGSNVLGRFLPTGDAVATIQPEDAFAVSLTVTRVDAPLLRPGLTGEVYFRGLSGETWPLEVETPVQATEGEGGDQKLSAWARLTQPGRDELIVGLTGFARVEAGEVMRIRALSRYVVEWGKVKAWQYLGLRL